MAEAGLAARPDLVAGRVARALALLDLGRGKEATEELGRVLAAVPDHPLAERALADDRAPFGDLAERELEDAFEAAEARPEEMVDANQVAEAALRSVEQEAAAASPAGADSPFATETMARLLERQGHAEQAAALRASLPELETGAAGAPPARGERARVIATLERWLDNLRRDSR